MPRVKICICGIWNERGERILASKSEEWGVYLGIPCRRKKTVREGVKMRVGVTQRERERGASYQSGGRDRKKRGGGGKTVRHREIVPGNVVHPL